MRAAPLLLVAALDVAACDAPEKPPKTVSVDRKVEPTQTKPAAHTEAKQPRAEAKRAPVDAPKEKAPEITPAELKAALALATEFGKNAAKLAVDPELEEQLTKKVAKKHKLSVEQLDSAYSRAMVSHQAEITNAMNAAAR